MFMQTFKQKSVMENYTEFCTTFGERTFVKQNTK